MISEEEMWYSVNHKVKVITANGEKIIDKVILFQSEYDSGCDEACIWLDGYNYILR